MRTRNDATADRPLDLAPADLASDELASADLAPADLVSVGTTADRPLKLARLRSILEAHDAEAIRLSSSDSLSWLFDGARTCVPLGGAPVFSALVDASGTVTVRALANEAQRLADEEITGEVAWEIVPWHAALDVAGPGVLMEAEVSAELRAARAALTSLEQERYRALGADTARAVSRVLERAEPTWTERELAGRLARAVYGIGAEPSVVLVAGSSRGHVQHPIPTDARLGERAMAVVTTVRHGLHASMSRWIDFGVRNSFAEVEAALREVEADAFEATRADRRLSEVLASIAGAYKEHGFGADAWTAHHQGGPTGYVGRDPKAHPSADEVLTSPQAFAWNPWVPGAKIEDTVLIDGGKVEVLTQDPAWPATPVRGLDRPVPLLLG